MKLQLYIIINTIVICLTFSSNNLFADNFTFAKVIIQEPVGIPRPLEYAELQIQINLLEIQKDGLNIIAENLQNGEIIICQVLGKRNFKEENITLFHIVFPISIKANERKIFLIKGVENKNCVSTNLKVKGEELDLVIDNDYYTADLSKSNKSEAKNNYSGQLSELKIKMDFDQLLFRTENRMHWAPNFQKQELKYYSTIAGWENPKVFKVNQGPYLISTHRQDTAPDHSEIILTANYSFYADLPYFKFFSSMNIVEDITLSLLRNDEMTMDSLFTNVAYQNNYGVIIDLLFSDRYKELKENPIQNNSPWLCFYNEDKGYAFGSIRIKYDNNNQSGLPSPTFFPHTKISDGAEGGKYWNRRLINEKPMFVPKGSSYVEENAYLVFKISKDKKFDEIVHWMKIIQNPIEVSLM